MDPQRDALHATIHEDRYTAIEYPGIIQNEKKALQTLGGIANISKALSIPTARIHLNFRPEMHFSRAANGDAIAAQALMLRLRKIRNRTTGEEKVVVCDVHVVPTVFRFNGMCDYQFDPFRRVPGDNSYEVFYRDIVPQRPSLAAREWLNRSNVPLYLPPSVFARQDTPGRYDYAPKFKTESRIQEEIKTDEKEQIRVLRKSRKNNAISVYYNQSVPDVPNKEAMERLNSKELRTCYEVMQGVFRERPIWPKSAIAHKMSDRYSLNAVRFVLPCVSYYCLSGPWARMWIRFGYNPKIDKAAKFLQTVDFRIVPRFTGEELMVPPRRRTQERADPIPRGPTNIRAAVTDESSSKETLDEYSYIFKPDVLPTARQINYMLCDIHEENVQKIVHSNNGEEPDVCDPIDGWCVKGYATKVRDILSQYTDKALGRRRPPVHQPPRRSRVRLPAAAPKDDDEEDGEMIQPTMEIVPGTCETVTFDNGQSEYTIVSILNDSDLEDATSSPSKSVDT